MREAAWIVFHIAIALPVALILSVVLRELIRAAVALATGFRVFELRFGVGQSLFSHPVGPIDLSLGALPLGGATIAASAIAKHHRRRRVFVAVAPLVAQLAGFAWASWLGRTDLVQIRSGFAPITVFAFAQLMLFVLHSFLPIRWAADEQTDLRALIEIVFGSAPAHRRTRAAYYALATRHAIERGRIEAAHAALQQGLKQLGPEPLLVECQTILATRELSSVVDQGESAEALRILLEWAPPDERDPPSTAYALKRLRRIGIYALPISVAGMVLAAAHHETISDELTRRWINHGHALLESADASSCAAHRAKSERWPVELKPVASLQLSRDHHDLTARLLACEGASQQAEHVARNALMAAKEARGEHDMSAIDKPNLWVADELRVIEILGFQVELKLAQGTFRAALRTLQNADRQLDLVREQLPGVATADQRIQLNALLDAQQNIIQAQRQRIQTEMASRSTDFPARFARKPTEGS